MSWEFEADVKVFAFLKASKVRVKCWKFFGDFNTKDFYIKMTQHLRYKYFYKKAKKFDFLTYAKNVDIASYEEEDPAVARFSKEERQSKGKVYTKDPTIVNWIHDKLEKYSSEVSSPISLDKTYWEPACGTGTFVLDWYERLMKHWRANKEKYPELEDEDKAHRFIIEKCIFFSDIDPFAIRLCCLSLFLKNPRVIGLKFNKHEGDSLLDDPFKLEDGTLRKFDYVAGNPPYIGFNNGKSDEERSGGLPKELKEKYKEYESYSRYGDLYDLFIEVGLRRGLFVGFIVRSGVLDLDTKGHDNLRKLLSDNYYLLDKGEGVFKEINLTGQILILSAISVGNDLNSLLQKKKVKRLNINTGKVLSDFVDRVGGFNTTKNLESVAKKRKSIDLYVEGDKKYITSERQFAKYSSVDIKYCLDPKICDGLDLVSLWNKKGILVKYTINFALQNQGFTIGDEDCWGQINCATKLVPKDFLHLKQILAILNSSLIIFLIKEEADCRAGNQEWIKVSTKIYDSLPVPIQLDSRLDPLVDKMLLNPNDKENEAEINKIVYELYGLTEEEIKVVEEAVK